MKSKKKPDSSSNDLLIITNSIQTSDTDSILSASISLDSEINNKLKSKNNPIDQFIQNLNSHRELISSQLEHSLESTSLSESESGSDHPIQLEPNTTPRYNSISSFNNHKITLESASESDIVSDPPDSLLNLVIDKIIGINHPTFNESLDPLMFYVKYKNVSYRSCEWVSREAFSNSNEEKTKLNFFLKNQTPFRPVPFFNQTVSLAFNDGNDGNHFKLYKPAKVEFDEGFVTPERILSIRSSLDETKYLVKWVSLDITESTWETDISEELITEYEESNMYVHSACYDHSINENLRQFVEFENSPIFENDNELTDYQVEGLNWLEYCWFKRMNSILSDEKGFGKRIESISILNILSTFYSNWGPFLIVCPNSNIWKWLKELEEWTNFRIVCMNGNGKSQRMIKKYLIYQYDQEHETQEQEKIKFDVMIISYETLSKELEFIKTFEFMYTIIDEVQNIKNYKTNIYNDCISIRTFHKLLIARKPIQNNLYEIWSLLHFINPAIFNEFTTFKTIFDFKEDSEIKEKIQEVIEPYVLSRKKKEINFEQPEKEEMIIEVEMTSIQRRYSKLIIKNNLKTLKDILSTRINLNNIMIQFRKLFCHPFLIPGLKDICYSKYKKSYGISNSTKLQPDDEMNSLISSSGKTILIDKLLPKLKEENHKVLIISQMLKMLDIIEDYLVYKGYFYERLDESCSLNNRNMSIARFHNDDNVFVFLLLARAGGADINLKSADTVIIYDGDWNPQNDIQAQLRYHRIGITKKVNVYRLITRGCYESEIFFNASREHAFDFAVLDSDPNVSLDHFNENGQLNGKDLKMKSRFELQTILRKGAYYTFNDDPNEIDNFCSENIEQILDHRSHSKKDLISDGNSRFSRVSFDAEIDDTEINKQDFWNKLVTANDNLSDRNEANFDHESDAIESRHSKTNTNYNSSQIKDSFKSPRISSSSFASRHSLFSSSSSSYYSVSDNDIASQRSDDADNEDEDENLSAVPDDYDDNKDSKKNFGDAVDVANGHNQILPNTQMNTQMMSNYSNIGLNMLNQRAPAYSSFSSMSNLNAVQGMNQAYIYPNHINQYAYANYARNSGNLQASTYMNSKETPKNTTNTTQTVKQVYDAQYFLAKPSSQATQNSNQQSTAPSESAQKATSNQQKTAPPESAQKVALSQQSTTPSESVLQQESHSSRVMPNTQINTQTMPNYSSSGLNMSNQRVPAYSSFPYTSILNAVPRMNQAYIYPNHINQYAYANYARNSGNLQASTYMNSKEAPKNTPNTTQTVKQVYDAQYFLSKPSSQATQNSNQQSTAPPESAQKIASNQQKTAPPESAQKTTSNQQKTALSESAQKTTSNQQKTALSESAQKTTSNQQKTAPSESAQKTTSNQQKTALSESAQKTTSNQQKTAPSESAQKVASNQQKTALSESAQKTTSSQQKTAPSESAQKVASNQQSTAQSKSSQKTTSNQQKTTPSKSVLQQESHLNQRVPVCSSSTPILNAAPVMNQVYNYPSHINQYAYAIQLRNARNLQATPKNAPNATQMVKQVYNTQYSHSGASSQTNHNSNQQSTASNNKANNCSSDDVIIVDKFSDDEDNIISEDPIKISDDEDSIISEDPIKNSDDDIIINEDPIKHSDDDENIIDSKDSNKLSKEEEDEDDEDSIISEDPSMPSCNNNNNNNDEEDDDEDSIISEDPSNLSKEEEDDDEDSIISEDPNNLSNNNNNNDDDDDDDEDSIISEDPNKLSDDEDEDSIISEDSNDFSDKKSPVTTKVTLPSTSKAASPIAVTSFDLTSLPVKSTTLYEVIKKLDKSFERQYYVKIFECIKKHGIFGSRFYLSDIMHEIGKTLFLLAYCRFSNENFHSYAPNIVNQILKTPFKEFIDNQFLTSLFKGKEREFVIETYKRDDLYKTSLFVSNEKLPKNFQFAPEMNVPLGWMPIDDFVILVSSCYDSEKLHFNEILNKFPSLKEWIPKRVEFISKEISVLIPAGYDFLNKKHGDLEKFKTLNIHVIYPQQLSICMQKKLLRVFYLYGIPKKNGIQKIKAILKCESLFNDKNEDLILIFAIKILNEAIKYKPDLYNLLDSLKSINKNCIFDKNRVNIKWIKKEAIQAVASNLDLIYKVRENYNSNLSLDFIALPDWSDIKEKCNWWCLYYDEILFKITAYYGFLFNSILCKYIPSDDIDYNTIISWRNEEISNLSPIKKPEMDYLGDVLSFEKKRERITQILHLLKLYKSNESND